jgi:hypothetical protein
VFPLAFQESQTRKQMRVGQAAQMAGQKPPPVVDQDLQQMAPPQALPEDQGIGALNAPNLQRMADGGIAGYADGGQQPGMFNYAQMAPAVDLHPNSGVTPRSMASGGITGYAAGGALQNVAAQLQQADAQLATAVRSGDPQAVEYYTQARDALRGKLAQTAASLNTPIQTPTGLATLASKPTEQAGAGLGPEYDRYLAKETPKTTDRGLGSLVAQTPLPAAISPEKATQMAGKFVDDTDLRAQLTDAQQQQLVSNAYLKDRAEELRPKGIAYADLERQLKKEEADTSGQKEQATGMALLKAGLAIAAGGSPYALQNIGQGALAGVADYQDALKDMKKMARERMKMSADIEQARRAESRDDYKTQMSFEEKAQDRADKLTEKGIDVTAKIFGVKTEVAKDIWATTFKETEATKRSNTAANASANAQLNLFTALGNAPEGSALRKGFDLQTLKQHAASLQEQWSRQAYPNGNMGEPNTNFLRRYPTPQTYIQENMESMNMAGAGGVGGGFVQPPANATVLQAPKK